MSPFSWLPMLPMVPEKAKQNIEKPPCPHCNERRRIVRYGSYKRQRYASLSELIAVQRYECGNPGCPRRTFSVPPHGLLPHERIPLWLILAMYRLHLEQTYCINALAIMLGHSWTTIRRAVTLAGRVLRWCRREIAAGTLPPWPCHPQRWPTFCRLYSYAFRPGCYAYHPTNTTQ